MKKETFFFTGNSGTQLPAVLWLPEGTVEGLVQISHGMTEHIGRYEELAGDLTAQGFAVAGFDMRGHGQNPGDRQVASFAEGGWQATLEDMRLFFSLLSERFAGVSHYMLGFSLGSFLLREYLAQHSQGIAGAVIMGTGHQPGWMLSVIRGIVSGQIRKVGFDCTSDLVRKLSFGTYNQKFRPNATEADWLCADAGERDRYLSDPLVRRDISAGLFWELLGSMQRTASPSAYSAWNKELPVLLISGGEDPVGDFGKGIARIRSQMVKSGMNHITVQLFPDARHDLLHETHFGAEAARNCISQWLRQQK